MTTKEDIAALHDIHPEWTVRQVADALKCSTGYVRATARRGSFKFRLEHEAMNEELAEAARQVLGEYVALASMTGDPEKKPKVIRLRKALRQL